MNFKRQSISYSQTGSYAAIVLDYLNQVEKLKPFYKYSLSEQSLEEAINNRLQYTTNRKALHLALQQQYRGLEISETVEKNIHLLKADNTLTITTAHQPNIFTGPLYFIYKILHTIKLAEQCQQKFPEYNFVPIYYMGSEDADLDELGHIYLNKEKLIWQTTQTGAVGRMQVDEEFLKLLKRIALELGVLPHSSEIMSAVAKCYAKGESIQNATLGFVNYLFGRYGLVVVIPDSAILKSVAIDMFKEELLYQHSSALVEQTSDNLMAAGYKPQAHGRAINFFYLKEDGSRLRIEKQDSLWHVVDSDISFSEKELIEDLNIHPERYSPNVILRGLFQETILPNIAFIGGGGELAYWLELKNIFEHYNVPYPLLLLRNSFLIVNKTQLSKVKKLGFVIKDLFAPLLGLQSKWVKAHSKNNTSTSQALMGLKRIYEDLIEQATPISSSLRGHIYALQKQSEKKIAELEKKLLRAEKRNYADAMRQIENLKQQLFPIHNLQERIDNILVYYAKWGPAFIDMLYSYSYTLEQEFVILEESSDS